MATPAHQDLLPDEELSLRPVGSLPPPLNTPSQVRPARPSQIYSARTPARRVGLFLKILFGDMTIWAVLSGVLTYEVARRGLDPQHALVGAAAGFVVAIAVSIGLKQVANRVVRLNRSALEISRGDLSKPLDISRSSVFGADEVDELSVAISHMQENLRDLVRHIQNTSRDVANSADEMQVNTGNVTASAEEIKESMDRIAKGAEEQLRLVGSQRFGRCRAGRPPLETPFRQSLRSNPESLRVIRQYPDGLSAPVETVPRRAAAAACIARPTAARPGPSSRQVDFRPSPGDGSRWQWRRRTRAWSTRSSSRRTPRCTGQRTAAGPGRRATRAR